MKWAQMKWNAIRGFTKPTPIKLGLGHRCCKKALKLLILTLKSRMADLICQQITAKKPSWKVGSSFSIKKITKSLPKVQIDDDSDLIDEDSLLTEEDLKKPQLPNGKRSAIRLFISDIISFISSTLNSICCSLAGAVGDCEVGKTKKACKNCSCGRAEAETKVQLGPTAEQLDNPQSACGSVWFLLYRFFI